jgi:hypothetical protein
MEIGTGAGGWALKNFTGAPLYLILLNGTQPEFLKCSKTLLVDMLENSRERKYEFILHLTSPAEFLYIGIGKEFIHGKERRI